MHLLLHNVAFSFSILVAFFVIAFLFIKAKKDTARMTLILTYCGVVIFLVSHVVGVSVVDSDVSRRILMFNLVDIFIPIFTAHCVFAFVGKQHEQRYVIATSYVVGAFLFIFFMVKPYMFLVQSVPKLYFPNYYQPGPYYWVMLVFFFVLVLYFLYILRSAYTQADGIDKNRIKYFTVALIFGYAIGSVDFLLIYNIPVDPLWGFLFVPLFTIPFTYAAVKYELMDIRLIAKKAFIYAIVTSLFVSIFISFDFISTSITHAYPGFPTWILSVALALVAAIGVLLIWRKVSESDMLKYEFIDVVTHKFRTPLTSIIWSNENLDKHVNDDIREDVEHIKAASQKLVELTDILVNISGSDKKNFQYNFTRINVGNLVSGLLSGYAEKIKSKNISFVQSIDPACVVVGDIHKLKFIFQTLFENALSYTSSGGSLSISVLLLDKMKWVEINITDSGIGISNQDIKFIFTKFYRTENGKKVDTEGMGIGLYLARQIVERHDGSIVVSSPGEGRGATFSVRLPSVS